MATAKPWVLGDPCPNGCGSLVPVPPPSDSERARAASKDANSWVPIPPTKDSADSDQLAELGPLHRCPICHYAARITPQLA